MNYQQRLEAKNREERNRKLRRAAKTALIGFLVLIGGGIIIWGIANMPKASEEGIISRVGLHWHSELTIVIKGVKQKIPANIGLGLKENPIHTHDDTGIIHLEFGGIVTKNNLRLGQFFKIWGKKFNKECIFDNCNGPAGKVKMTVNGQNNLEFENYIMKDSDKIEIGYE